MNNTLEGNIITTLGRWLSYSNLLRLREMEMGRIICTCLAITTDIEKGKCFRKGEIGKSWGSFKCYIGALSHLLELSA